MADLVETMKSVLAWIEHWERDREHNLMPTAESLASAKREIRDVLNKWEGKRLPNPGASWSNPIWHGKWRIYFSDSPLPGEAYAFIHDDFDGADDALDDRHGYARTVDEAKAAIDEKESE